MKKIIIVWDLDGAIGQINATYPYNFNYKSLERELDNVRYALNKLDEYKIKTCFAVTGFSAEEGKYPYVFPELINEISSRGHEIASHSWRHEWAPLFAEKQIQLSLKRSKSTLEKCISIRQDVIGFVPPHNRPMTWLKKGAFSFGDKGIYPFFRMGDNGQLLKQLKLNRYKWIRISHQNIFQKFGIKSKNITGRIYKYDDIMVLENHYAGFDERVVSHILQTEYSTYTISAHPLMLSFPNKKENMQNFEMFLQRLNEFKESIKFTTPKQILTDLFSKVLSEDQI